MHTGLQNTRKNTENQKFLFKQGPSFLKNTWGPSYHSYVTTFTKRLLTNQTNQTKTTESAHMTTTSSGDGACRKRNHVSYQPPAHRRLLAFPAFSIIIGEDSFVITSRQFGIDSCLQCAFQPLVHGPFLESIMLFSS